MSDLKYCKYKIQPDVGIEIFRVFEKEHISCTLGGFSPNYKKEIKTLIFNDYSAMYNSKIIDGLLEDEDIPFGTVLTCFLRYCLFVNADTTPVKPLPGIPVSLLKDIFSLKTKEAEDHLNFLLGSPMSNIHKLPERIKNLIVEEFEL